MGSMVNKIIVGAEEASALQNYMGLGKEALVGLGWGPEWTDFLRWKGRIIWLEALTIGFC